MANLRVTELNTLTGADVSVTNDRAYIVDASEVGIAKSKQISIKELVANTEVFEQSGSGAGSSRSLQTELRELVFNVRSGPFGATGNGTTDDATAISNAIAACEAAGGGIVYFPYGNYLIGSQLSTTDNKYVLLQGTGFGSQIKKGFNGAMLSLGQRARMKQLYLNGDGATYTGRGVIISSGSASNPPSMRAIDDCDILDTQSYGVEFTQAQAGYGSVIHSSRIIPTSTSTPAVKFPNDAGNTGNRTLSHVFTDSSEIADLATAENTLIIGCQGAGPLFSGTPLKATITACRIAANAGGSWTVKGNGTVIVGNLLSPAAMTFDSGLSNSRFKGNNITAGTTITDNATGVTGANDIDIDYATYTPTWAATGGSPAIGDGSLIASKERQGTKCFVNIKLTGGASTTWTGTAYTFSVPYTSTRDQVGAAGCFDATGNLYSCTAYLAAGASVVKVIVNAPTTTFAGATVPFTWATGDILWIDLCYWIN